MINKLITNFNRYHQKAKPAPPIRNIPGGDIPAVTGTKSEIRQISGGDRHLSNHTKRAGVFPRLGVLLVLWYVEV
jgi:hypothetical protein